MIPSLVHFIWIEKSRPFGRVEFLSIKSALKNTPYQIILHTNLQPGQAGQYDPYTLINERFSIKYENYSCIVKGIQVKPATLSDILRIQILQEYGGIYTDLDVIWLQEFPIPLTDFTLVGTWDNQSYKILANGILASKKDYDFSSLLKTFDDIFDSLAAKGITSIEGDTLKEHITLYKATGNFFKEHADHILKKKWFLKNSWKNIWRFLTNQIPEEKITLTGITGIHIWTCGLFGEYKCDTTLLLTKHSGLKKICDELEE
jgi:hypothetical protein